MRLEGGKRPPPFLPATWGIGEFQKLPFIINDFYIKI